MPNCYNSSALELALCCGDVGKGKPCVEQAPLTKNRFVFIADDTTPSSLTHLLSHILFQTEMYDDIQIGYGSVFIF